MSTSALDPSRVGMDIEANHRTTSVRSTRARFALREPHETTLAPKMHTIRAARNDYADECQFRNQLAHGLTVNVRRKRLVVTQQNHELRSTSAETVTSRCSVAHQPLRFG